jgi:hypothetical protein
MAQAEEIRYNVACVDCGSVFQPRPRSPLWWRAKQREKEGFLDAVYVSGEKCGCVKKQVRPDAPFRVTGYDGMCEDYDVPFTNFVKAVKFFKDAVDAGDVVFIIGISDAVRQKIQYGF